MLSPRASVFLHPLQGNSSAVGGVRLACTCVHMFNLCTHVQHVTAAVRHIRGTRGMLLMSIHAKDRMQAYDSRGGEISTLRLPGVANPPAESAVDSLLAAAAAISV